MLMSWQSTKTALQTIGWLRLILVYVSPLYNLYPFAAVVCQHIDIMVCKIGWGAYILC
jgi:hypothetical protein